MIDAEMTPDMMIGAYKQTYGNVVAGLIDECAALRAQLNAVSKAAVAMGQELDEIKADLEGQTAEADLADVIDLADEVLDGQDDEEEPDPVG